jgi:hypothetical protein
MAQLAVKRASGEKGVGATKPFEETIVDRSTVE